MRDAPITANAEHDPPRPRSQFDPVFRRGFTDTFVLDMAARALGAVSIVVLIRGLSVSAYAFVTLFLVLSQLFASAAGGGVRTRYLRLEAERVSRGESRPAASFWYALISSSLLVVAVALALLPIVHFFVDVPAGANPAELVIFSIGFAIGLNGSDLTVAYYQARLRFRLAGAIGVIRAAAVLAVSIVVVAMDVNQSPALPLWFIGGILVTALIVIAWIPSNNDIRVETAARPRTLLSSEEGWLTIYFLAASGFAYVDVLVAAMFLGPTDVATLGATLRYLSVLMAAIPAIGAVLRVRAAQSDVVDSGDNQRRLVLSWVRVTALPGIAVLVVSVALTPLLIPFVDGGRYPGSVVALQIFLVAAAVAYVTEPSPNVLMAQDRNAALALLFGLALTINLVGDVLVAPRWGVTGIAAVSTASFVVLRVALTVLSLRVARRAVLASGVS